MKPRSRFPMTQEQLFTEAMALKPQDREELADKLLLSLTAAQCAEIDAARLRECHRRASEIERGEVVSVPGDVVMHDARKAVRWARR